MKIFLIYLDLAYRMIRALIWFFFLQIKNGTLFETLAGSRKKGKLVIAGEISFADLLERKARERGDAPFLMFYERTLSLREINEASNRVARRLLELGAGPGQAAAIMMANSPEWLMVFYALQKLGMIAVPVHNALKGEGLRYILDHSESRFLFIDQSFIPELERVREGLPLLEQVAVNVEDGEEGWPIPQWARPLDYYLDKSLNSDNPGLQFDRNNICLLMYTSGTTGLPKGVVYRYNRSGVTMYGLAAHMLYNSSDILYTCLPLFHANALFLTVTEAIWMDIKVGLGKRFSASRLWDEVRMYKATSFNSLSAMTPILMKQPRKPNDRDNQVRLVLTSACPAAVWKDFEERFGVKIAEAYGAVDGGGFTTFNFGTGPVGSIGKPLFGKYRIIDEEGRDVEQGKIGELINWIGLDKGEVTYYKNEKATNEKVREGWLYTGDLIYQDAKGYMYFVGRSTESMRRRGENVSAYEVEREVEKHPDVLEAAAYGIPSELGEDDIMISVVPVEGGQIDAGALYQWLKEKLPRHAWPRYINLMDELPKTGTHRVMKKELAKIGVTENTIDFEERK